MVSDHSPHHFEVSFTNFQIWRPAYCSPRKDYEDSNVRLRATQSVRDCKPGGPADNQKNNPYFVPATSNLFYSTVLMI